MREKLWCNGLLPIVIKFTLFSHQDLSPYTASMSQECQENISNSPSRNKLRGAALSSEQSSTKAGLWTINRELAFQLAKVTVIVIIVQYCGLLTFNSQPAVDKIVRHKCYTSCQLSRIMRDSLTKDINLAHAWRTISLAWLTIRTNCSVTHN